MSKDLFGPAAVAVALALGLAVAISSSVNGVLATGTSTRHSVYVHPDPPHDEGRTYPWNAVYVAGLFEIYNFSVSYDADWVYFDTSFLTITNGYNGKYEFSHQMCQFFVDTDRRFGSGSFDSWGAKYLANGYISPEAPYEFTLVFTGWWAYITIAQNGIIDQTTSIPVHPKVLHNTTISMPVNRTLIGTPSLKWAYTVWCGSENYQQFRRIDKVRSEYAFGGGSDGRDDANVVDFLAPPNHNKKYTHEMYTLGLNTIFPPFGYNLYTDTSVATLDDPTGDVRKLASARYPTLTNYVDIQSTKVFDNPGFAIFRVQLKDMKENPSLPNNFEHLLIQIYVDTDNKLYSGGRNSIGNANFQLQDNKGWEFVLSADGNSYTLSKYSNNGDIDTQVIESIPSIRASNGIVELSVPKSMISDVTFKNVEDWRFIVVTGFTSSGNFQTLCTQILNAPPLNGNVVALPLIASNGIAPTVIYDQANTYNSELAVYTPSKSQSKKGSIGTYHIISFQSAFDGDYIRFTYRLNDFEKGGYDRPPLIQTYIDLDGSIWSGLLDVHKNSGASIHPSNAWELCFSANPISMVVELTTDGTNHTNISTMSIENGHVVVYIPITYFQTQPIMSTWKYGVIVGADDGHGGFSVFSQSPSPGHFHKKYPSIPTNIIDLMIPQGTDYNYFLQSWDTNGVFPFYIPFIGPGYPYYVPNLILHDAIGDESGVYPVNPIFSSQTSIFDIKSVSMDFSQSNVRFCIQMEELSSLRTNQNPIGYLGLQVYIDTDRVFNQGCFSSLENANIQFEKEHGWEYAVSIRGNMAYVRSCSSLSKGIIASYPIKVDSNRNIIFQLSTNITGVPTFSWTYSVVSGGVDSIKDNGMYLTKKKVATNIYFGGGDDSGYGPNIIDMAIPSSANQHSVMNSYNAMKQTLATVPPAGRHVFYGSVLWNQVDPTGDERGTYPQPLSQLEEKNIFDMLKFSIGVSNDDVWIWIPFSNVVTNQTYPRVHENTLLHIYIDKDIGAAGGSTKGLYNIKVQTGASSGWDYAITIYPGGSSFYEFNNTLGEYQLSKDPGEVYVEGNIIYWRRQWNESDLLTQSHWSYIVTSGCSSGNSESFVPFSSSTSSSTFGITGYTSLTPNIVDLITKPSQNQGQILSTFAPSSNSLAIVPFIGGSTVEPILSCADATGDEYGTYPTASVFGGTQPSGLLDIESFLVQSNWTHLLIELGFSKKLENPWKLKYGFSFPMFSIYCHKDGKSGVASVYDNEAVNLEHSWIWRFMGYGAGMNMRYGNSTVGSVSNLPTTNTASMGVDSSGKNIKIAIDLDQSGVPSDSWQFTVLVGLYDPISGKFTTRNRVASQRFMGGGDDDFYDPNIADILIPVYGSQKYVASRGKYDVNLQHAILSNYNPTAFKYATVPAISVSGGFSYDIWYQRDTTTSGSQKSDSWVIAVAVVVPSFIIFAVVFFFYHQQQKKARISDLGWNVKYSELSFINKVGSGSFGEVYRGEWRDSIVAIKTLASKDMSKVAIADFQREIAIMCEMRHPCLCMFMGGCAHLPDLFIISEFMDRGSLYDILHEEKIVIPQNMKYLFAADISKGVSFLHSHEPPVIHGDLKSLNILVDQKWQVKVSDFGLSKIKGSKLSGSNDTGSIMWASPEVLLGHPASERSDIYSFGVVLWEIFSGEELYNQIDINSLVCRVIQGYRPPMNEGLKETQGIDEMMKKCWDGRQEERPSMSTLRKQLTAIQVSLGIQVGSSLTPLSLSSQGSGSDTSSTKCFVTMEISNSTLIWEQHPNEMYHAINLYTSLMRSTITKFSGIEIKADSDAFTLLFRSVQSAAEWAVHFQLSLLDVMWPKKLLENSKYCSVIKHADQDTIIYAGPRVKIGVHSGDAELRENPATGQITYVGPAVSKSKHICNVAAPGQILVSDQAIAVAQFDQKFNSEHSVQEVSLISKYNTHTDGKLYEILHHRLKERATHPENLVNSHANMSNLNHSTKDEKSADEKPAFHILYEEIEIVRILGAGSFGQVLYGKYKDGDVAVKRLLRQKLNQKGIADFRREILVMKALEHPNICKMVGICTQAPNLCIVMEFMKYGSVESLLKTKDFAWTNELKVRMLRDAVSGLCYLHNLDPLVIHRDMKSANLLVGEDYFVKISDFGVSRVKNTHNTMTKCGTPAWAAPEILRGERYTEKVDIYSVGIVMWEMMTKKSPYVDLKLSSAVITKEIAEGRLRPTAFVKMPPNYESLMNICWSHDPNLRPSAKELLEHLLSPVILSTSKIPYTA